MLIISLKPIFVELNDSEYEFQLAISEVLIPFSKSDCRDIYNGDELIPFTERDHEYQLILIREFL